MKHPTKPRSFRAHHVQARKDDPTSDAIIVTPTVEMVNRSTPSRKTGSSPVSVASSQLGGSSVAAECAPAMTPTRRDKVLESACRKVYGKSVVPVQGRKDGLCGTPEPNALMGVVMHPVVVVGEDGGAEVTLEHSSFQERTKAEKVLPSEKPSALVTPYGRDIAALLDADISPSPVANKTRSLDSIVSSSERPAPVHIPDAFPPSSQAHNATSPHSPFGPKLCCGTGCWRGDDGDTTYVPPNQESIEETICGLLGDVGLDDCCDGWQAFSYFLLGPDQHELKSPIKQDIRQALRNRACNMNDRSRRLKELRDNLRPFDKYQAKIGRDDEVTITRTQSFCVSDQVSAKGRNLVPSEASGSIVSTSSTMWAAVNCISGAQSDSPAMVRTRGLSIPTEDDLCYDSDPEEITHRHAREGSRKKSEVVTFLRKGGWDGEFANVKQFHLNHEYARSNHVQPKRLNFDLHDEPSVKDYVKEMMNERMTLIWHRTGNSSEGISGSPLAVKAWIEHGHRLRSSLIQPKLMWKPVNQSLEQKASMGITSHNLHSIDLLDMIRIIELNRVEKRRPTIAKGITSFVVESLDESVLFEASSEVERDRIVHGLKLVVARLGSKVVVGDDDIFEEFFGFVPVGGLE